jgi:hypothetical protein
MAVPVCDLEGHAVHDHRDWLRNLPLLRVVDDHHVLLGLVLPTGYVLPPASPHSDTYHSAAYRNERCHTRADGRAVWPQNGVSGARRCRGQGRGVANGKDRRCYEVGGDPGERDGFAKRLSLILFMGFFITNFIVLPSSAGLRWVTVGGRPSLPSRYHISSISLHYHQHQLHDLRFTYPILSHI